jgi:hypothetical protein
MTPKFVAATEDRNAREASTRAVDGCGGGGGGEECDDDEDAESWWLW